jgi:hypothetical protein
VLDAQHTLGGIGDLPSGRVALQVLALPLQHASSNLSSGWVMLAGVLNVFQLAQRHIWVDKVRVAFNELGPLEIPGHCNRTAAKPFYGRICLICVALQDAGERIVCLLYFTNNNRL